MNKYLSNWGKNLLTQMERGKKFCIEINTGATQEKSANTNGTEKKISVSESILKRPWKKLQLIEMEREKISVSESILMQPEKTFRGHKWNRKRNICIIIPIQPEKNSADNIRTEKQVCSTSRCVLLTYFFNVIQRQTDGPTDIPSCRDAILHFCDVPGPP